MFQEIDRRYLLCFGYRKQLQSIRSDVGSSLFQPNCTTEQYFCLIVSMFDTFVMNVQKLNSKGILT